MAHGAARPDNEQPQGKQRGWAPVILQRTAQKYPAALASFFAARELGSGGCSRRPARKCRALLSGSRSTHANLHTRTPSPYPRAVQERSVPHVRVEVSPVAGRRACKTGVGGFSKRRLKKSHLVLLANCILLGVPVLAEDCSNPHPDVAGAQDREIVFVRLLECCFEVCSSSKCRSALPARVGVQFLRRLAREGALLRQRAWAFSLLHRALHQLSYLCMVLACFLHSTPHTIYRMDAVAESWPAISATATTGPRALLPIPKRRLSAGTPGSTTTQEWHAQR